MADEQVSEQELLAALAQLQVSDLLVQTLSTVSSLAYYRLAEEHRDLEQVRLAIEALRALLPVVSPSLPPELTRDFEQVTANLQLAYASAAAPKPASRDAPQGPRPIDPEADDVGDPVGRAAAEPEPEPGRLDV